MIALLPFFLSAAFTLFAYRRLLRYLHIFQQDDYNARRFLSWLVSRRVFDKSASFILILCAITGSILEDLNPALFHTTPVLVSLAFLFLSFLEEDPRKIGKKKLILTVRAKTILYVAAILAAAASAWLTDSKSALIWILPVQALPLSLTIATVLLSPHEKRVQNGFRKEAKKRLAEVSPTIVAITGSFGKTSVKHILGHILEMQDHTLFTPGGINADMGICRVIRESLQDKCRYFIVEMGAYGRGSIARLCKLTPPHAGIITAIGDAHVERFKTLETVARAKFELAEAVLKGNDGKIVIHQSILREPYAADFVERNRDRFLIVGTEDDCRIRSIEQSTAGLTVSLSWNEKSYALFAPLFGIHHGDNIALAFALAISLGIDPDRAIAALRSTPQIEHRLEVKPQPDGTVIIDDAYNSNPVGFDSALGLLHLFGTEKKARRILITPGIVELGDRHDAIHAELGKKATKYTDIVIAVCAKRIQAFVKAYRDTAPERLLIETDTLEEARSWLADNAKPGDIILYENDLPDLFEKKMRL